MAMRNTRSRRQQILQQLIEQGSVQVAELVARYAVSAVTIRTDLGHFEEQGLATRTHGGATLVRTPPQEQDMIQFMELLAVSETSRRSMLPKRFCELSIADIQSSLAQARRRALSR